MNKFFKTFFKTEKSGLESVSPLVYYLFTMGR